VYIVAAALVVAVGIAWLLLRGVEQASSPTGPGSPTSPTQAMA
jgi:hypothetical protein